MPKVNVEHIIEELNNRGIRYILIGGQAVTLYGSPIVSFDFDFWIDPAQKKDFFKLADFLSLEYGNEARRKPLAIFYAEEEKIDVFFVKKMSTKEGLFLAFEECYKNSVTLQDPTGFVVRLPAINDLITLKACKKKPSAKDLEDIEYLKIIKSLGESADHP